MNINKIVCLLLLMPAGFAMAQDKFEISGKLPKAGKDKKVILSYVNSEGKSAKDSAVLKNGTFSMSGTTAFGNKAYLTLMPVKRDTSRRNSGADYKEFYLEKGRYKVTGTDSMSKASITGMQAQADYLAYTAQMGTKPAQFKAISQSFMKARSAKDTAEMKKIQDQAKPLMASMEAVLDSFIFNHPDSYVTVDLVNDNRTAVIDPKVFDPYYKALSPRVLSSFTGKKVTAKYEKARQISIGNTFDFTQEDTQGKLFQLSSLRGKYVLVDFWASWCAPCRAENPNLLKAYNQLKDKNFEVVGISLDENKTSWLKAIEKDGLPWIHVSDLKGWKNDVAIKYGITAVPQNVLVDPNGKIVAKNLRGEDLYARLKDLIK